MLKIRPTKLLNYQLSQKFSTPLQLVRQKHRIINRNPCFDKGVPIYKGHKAPPPKAHRSQRRRDQLQPSQGYKGALIATQVRLAMIG
jgi:hypothetical protein